MMATTRQESKFDKTLLVPSVESGLVRVLLLEIDYQKTTEAVKLDLRDRFDFTVKGAFDCIDTMEPRGQVDRCEIRKFVDEHFRWLSESELDSIIRRCDTDEDEAISYVEFSELMRGIRPELTPQKTTKSQYEYTSPMAYHSRTEIKHNYTARPITTVHQSTYHPREEVKVTTHYSPTKHSYYSHAKPVIKASLHQSSPYRRSTAVESPSKVSARQVSPRYTTQAYSPVKHEHNTEQKDSSYLRLRTPMKYDSPTKFHTHRSPVRVEIEEVKYISPMHSPVRCSPRYSAIKTANSLITRTTHHHGLFTHTEIHTTNESPMKGFEEEEFVESLKALIKLESSLEKAKQVLAHRRDFTINDAFRIFDILNQGRISTLAIKDVYDQYGIFITDEDAKLIMSRFDRDRDERLTFEEFSDMFIPIDTVFANSLDARSRRYPSGYYAGSEITDSITRSNFSYVLRSTLDVERHAEGIRQKHSERPLFSGVEAYDAVNRFGRSLFHEYITKEDFSILLQRHRFFATNRELNMIMDRFDKNKDEKVTYSEFMSEITPHSPSKY